MNASPPRYENDDQRQDHRNRRLGKPQFDLTRKETS
jgi:hypothetical protein